MSGVPILRNATSTVRPILRGVIHEVGLGIALVAGTLLIATAPGGRASLGASIFAASVAAMLTASTLYHRVSWRPNARMWMRRVDHAGIYLLIAGTYTPVGLLKLHGWVQTVVLGLVWIGAGLAILAKFLWVGAPKWVAALTALSLGWVGLLAMPQLAHSAGAAAVALLLAGGLAYSVGAIVYVRRKPNLLPRVFGYHELFHVLTLIAIACQYVAVAFFVVR